MIRYVVLRKIPTSAELEPTQLSRIAPVLQQQYA
jgi:hypothetical protein